MILLRLFVLRLIVLLGGPAGAQEPTVIVQDRKILTQLEDMGYGFETVFGGAEKHDLASLYATKPGYRQMIDLIADDIATLREQMKAGGRTSKRSPMGMSAA